MRLADFSGDARAIAGADTFGVVLGRPDSCARLVTRHRAGTSAHVMPLDRLPSVLAPALDALTVIAPLSAHAEAPHPVFERMRKEGVNCLWLVPLPGRLGLLWTGKRDVSPITDAQRAAFEALSARVAAAMHERESRDARVARLARIDTIEDVLPVISGALDVREVFDRLSAVARSVLPHEAAIIQILEDDHRQAELFALDGLPREHVATTFATEYAPVFNEHFEFSLFDDLLRSPIERERPPAKAGMRSALRVPLRFDGRVGGALQFSSSRLSSYSEADAPVGRRIAEYVALAISHQRLADESRRAARLRERSRSLLTLDDLLSALSGVIDIREVFDRVSDIAQKVLAHDAIVVIVPTGEGDRAQHYALRGFGDRAPAVESRVREPELLTIAWDYRIIDDLAQHPAYADSPAAGAGLHGALLLPVTLDGRLQAFLSFMSREAGRFTRDDVLVGRRIADHIALALSHQKLAEEARRSEELSARRENLDLLDELLATLTGTAALSDLFDRISDLAKKVIPHDAMALPVLLPDGVHARRYASAGLDVAGIPEIIPVPPGFIRDPDWQYDLIDDASARPEPYNLRMAEMGFRSALRVPIRIEGKFAAGIAFMGHEPGVFKPSDVVTARRIAERFALCLARERRAEASKRADAASARASRLEARVRELSDELDARTGYKRVVGESASWRHVLVQATQVAPTDTTVLLLGESGTGKEVVARFLHRASGRKDGRFIALNCAALPEQLLEAELFGYERGAFTGATQSKPGQLEQAAGGTLFLDEVAEMSPSAQAKFLRVLQEREFQRLGGTRVLKTDARIVAATNRDLARAIQQGTFREDLFYRLNVFAIHLPPLRDRRDDVLPLSEAFLAEYGRGLGRPPSGISRDARTLLMDYHWPGNVRELRNVLERAAILCDGGLITTDYLALTVGAPIVPAPSAAPAAAVETAPAPPMSSATDLSSMERAMIEQALQTARFNKSKAAAALGLTRAQLYVRMRRHGLE